MYKHKLHLHEHVCTLLTNFEISKRKDVDEK